MHDPPEREIDLRDDRAAAPNCRTPAGLWFQSRLVEHLRAGGFPVLATRMPGGYVPGNPAQLAEAGRGLARYHALARTFRLRFRAAGRPALPSLERSGPYALARFSAAAGPFLAAAERNRLSRAASFLWSQFIRVPEALADVVPGLPQLVVHGSWEPAALVFRDDRLTGVRGFERAAYDLRALDLGHAVAAFAAAPVGLDLERAAGLLAAYRVVEPVPRPELAALPLLLRARSLARVLEASSGFVPAEVATPDEEARRLVDGIGADAELCRWLEDREPELVAAASASLVA